ncbi:hypothetical protein VUR80DRAFT_9079 [Thermomyces stellatus]
MSPPLTVSTHARQPDAAHLPPLNSIFSYSVDLTRQRSLNAPRAPSRNCVSLIWSRDHIASYTFREEIHTTESGEGSLTKPSMMLTRLRFHISCRVPRRSGHVPDAHSSGTCQSRLEWPPPLQGGRPGPAPGGGGRGECISRVARDRRDSNQSLRITR